MKKLICLIYVCAFLAACGAKEPKVETGQAILAGFSSAGETENSKRLGELTAQLHEVKQDIEIINRRNMAIEEKYKQIIELFVAYRETLTAINSKVDNFTLTKNLAYSNKGVSLYGNRNLTGEPVKIISPDSMVEILEGEAGTAGVAAVRSADVYGYADGRSFTKLLK
ncbi:hypothetical protein EP073_09445 [Geovibrio thiophilus]|uniref:Uncharacterized protein n=1 Tax=Geovibrio thiophilus TaxID=139438 RepID=A0A410JZJ5_9BACT|nr:hypothetical protein [Geovibrio thiophilus]QAR33616.1 hypothetical protein EP073_09445 [Geovibrio thiophilus]